MRVLTIDCPKSTYNSSTVWTSMFAGVQPVSLVTLQRSLVISLFLFAFIYLLIYLLIYLHNYLFIYLLNYLFIYLLIDLLFFNLDKISLQPVNAFIVIKNSAKKVNINKCNNNNNNCNNI